MKKTLVLAAALCVTAGVANAQVTIIGGATGNGDFQAGGAGVAQTYDQTANWFHGDGAETVNFTQTSQMGGSSDPAHPGDGFTRGGMPFQNRLQVNDTGYTIAGAGDAFSISYDFGAGGGQAGWTNTADQVMNVFLFTSAVAVDGNLTAGDITILAGSTDGYAIDRANDGQWTSYSSANFYTATAADASKTVYLGMEFDRGTTAVNLFPRIDIVNLTVVPVPEPATFSLAVLGGIGMLLVRRRVTKP